jgi:acyl carrier protein
MIELIMKIEDEFDVEICDEDAYTFMTIRDIVNFLDKNTCN